MKYRSICEGAESISVVGVGGNIFGYASDERETNEILWAAKDIGINLVDTADVYSEGQSEIMIGNALRGRRSEWIISSKVGVRSNETGCGKGSKTLIFQRIDDSLRRLQTDYLDIYQLHHWDPNTPVEETIEAMQTLCSAGKIRFYGVSNFKPDQVSLFVNAATCSNHCSPATAQIAYNILKRKNLDIYLKERKKGWPLLLVYGALGRGVLTGKYRKGESITIHTRASRSVHIKSDLQPEVLDIVDNLTKIATTAGLTMPQLALAFTIRNPEVASTLVGIRTISQLEGISEGVERNLPTTFWSTIDRYLASLPELKNVSLGVTKDFAEL